MWHIYLHCSGFIHWHWGNTIAPVPVKIPWRRLLNWLWSNHYKTQQNTTITDSKVHGANTGPTWVLSAPDGPHVGPMNLAIRDVHVSWDVLRILAILMVWVQTAISPWLTHWGRDKMAAILHTTFSNGFSWMKMYKFRLKLHWSLFLWVQLTISQHWFR